MPSTRRLAQQGSAVALASFLAVSSSRAALGQPSVREVAKRWRERPSMRLEELRRAWLESRGAELEGTRGARRERRTPWKGPAGLARRFHADGLAVTEPRPLNPLFDPLHLFDGEVGEPPPVAPLPRLFLADFDGDGDLDAFVGDKYGYVRYLRNDGGPGEPPVYVEPSGAASPTGSLDLSLDDEDPDDPPTYGSSAPTLVDVDGDGDLDLFVGQGFYAYGRVLFFENVDGTLARNDAENPLGAFQFGVGAATPTFVDVDEDGDFDAFVGTKLATLGPTGGEVYFLRNEGTAGAPAFVEQTDVAGSDPFAGQEFPAFTAPFFADVDGDGDPDAFVGNFYFTQFFRNDTLLPGPPAFVEQSGYEHPLGGGITPFGGPLLADVDGDGDLDAFVGLGYYKTYENGFLQYSENTGSSNVPRVLSPGDRLELVDVDGDGRLDALASLLDPRTVGDDPRGVVLEVGRVGTRAAAPGETFGVVYFRNVGTGSEPVWALQTGALNPFSTFNSGYGGPGFGYSLPSLAPTVGHLDGDAFLDAFVGTPYGYLDFLEDDGTGQLDPAATHPMEGVPFDASADPQLVDVNGDGELDLLVGYEPYDEAAEAYRSRVALFLNPTGAGDLDGPPDVVLDFTDTGLDRPAPTVADVDGDGDLDLLVGGYYYYEFTGSIGDNYGLTLFVENTGTPTAPAFSAASAVPVEAWTQAPTSPALGDVNGDGLLDLFLGNTAGAEAFLTAIPSLEVTKVVTGGDLAAGGTVEYTVTVTNVGTGTAADDPDDAELTDVLPPELTLVAASVVLGPGSVTTLGNTVRYDGALAPGESVVIAISADVYPAAQGVIENQAIAFFDSDADGDNDAAEPSDDPVTQADDDPTAFVVDPFEPLEVPTLSQWGAALFTGLLSLLGLFGLRRFNG